MDRNAICECGAEPLSGAPAKGNRRKKRFPLRMSRVAFGEGLPCVPRLCALMSIIFGLWLAWGTRAAGAGEVMQCAAVPGGKDWHYRTKIPGYVGDVKDDRCWYNGPRMKPRGELFWPSASNPTPINVGEPMRPPWELEQRWHGDKQ